MAVVWKVQQRLLAIIWRTMDKESLASTYKSQDTEEWLDVHFNRPIGYLWACQFRRWDIHPNVVTIVSIFLGMAAGWMFSYEGLMWNVGGVLLLMWANFYDSADGQLARMTGKKTRMGRILDGFAGDVWFFTIYVAISLRLMDKEMPFSSVAWGGWIWGLCIVAGVFFHSVQCKLADYYRNVHLYFLPEGHSELERSGNLREQLKVTPWKGNFCWRLFLEAYMRYTRHQERLTPCCQLLLKTVREKMNGEMPDGLRKKFREGSLPLMKYANFLTFNSRALTLYGACLLNVPWIYPLVEIVGFTWVARKMHKDHEALCFRLFEEYKDTKI